VVLARPLVLSILVVLPPAGCSVEALTATGRPCGASASCGPGTWCNPASKRCELVAAAVDAAVGDRGRGAESAGVDTSLADRASLDGPRPDQRRADLPRADKPLPHTPDVPLKDGDKDGVPDFADNCPAVSNPSQSDLDGDKLGDACDPDQDGDGVPNEHDPAPTVKNNVLFYAAPPTLQDFSCDSGNWSVTNGKLCHSSGNADGVCRLTGLPMMPGNYLAATRVSGGQPSANDPSPGLAVRMSQGNNRYFCGVDINSKRLILGKVVNNVWNKLADYPLKGIAGSYDLRLSVVGSQLVCSEPTLGVTVKDNDTQLASGPAGLEAYNVAACYDYLTVVAAGP
jgi:hypothetical protein